MKSTDVRAGMEWGQPLLVTESTYSAAVDTKCHIAAIAVPARYINYSRPFTRRFP
jgi:hypothetical protein